MHVVIMSGVSGSGKSTEVARLLRDEKSKVVSADDFFVVKGEYKFNPSLLGEAHGSCLRRFIAYAKFGLHEDHDLREITIIVDNTNTTTEEIAPYVAIAQAYMAESIELVTVFCDVDVAAGRNRHDVSLNVIEAQYRRIMARKIPPFWDVKLTEIRN